MSAPAFTPGPWCVSTDEYGDVVVDPVGDENRVCTVGKSGLGKPAVASFGHFDTPEVRADAALIAAAPELYAELQQFVNGVETRMIDSPADETLANITRRAKAALAKARGEA